MKRYYHLLIIMLFAVSASAQVNKGDWQFGISAAPLFDYSNQSYAQGLAGGYFAFYNNYNFSSKFSVSLTPYIGFTNLEDERAFLYNGPLEPYKENYSSLGINIHPRYYFTKSKLKPYVMFMVGIGKTKWTYDSEHFNSQNKFTTLNYGVGLGLSYYIRPSVMLDFNISYNKVKGLNTVGSPYTFAFPSIGLFKTIRCKKTKKSFKD